ncbi:SDR family oxidoreductase [Chitinasiproducens palmae]|uniref:NADP-dependent 3-hydroxy acid dehydrogenase YdfG n=1 Tax=Chitinasiproducens palmae TaxID=1770053 RepID=A0A1H2PPK1_9BURK|nr:SDR family oxidoreductase [Chitinasiproducens palmae]SDV48658.1 NADP-dependent 3-hydroxy acid dehydrogenase YdfG [Chitinasiproducens palmae]
MTTLKVAVVTGAGSGIGREVAVALAESGFCVALAGRRADALEATAARCRSARADAQTLCIPTDIRSPEAVDALFSRVRQTWERVDLLFNNAGVSPPASLIDEMSPDAWRDAMAINLDGAFLCARAAFAAMRTQVPPGGRIINNGSVSSQVPRPRSVAYTVAKFGIRGLTRSLALDGRRWGIACSQIDVGNASTDMTRRMAEGVMQADGSTAPEPTIDARHVADAVRYIANLPLDANVLDLTVMATAMPLLGRG